MSRNRIGADAIKPDAIRTANGQVFKHHEGAYASNLFSEEDIVLGALGFRTHKKFYSFGSGIDRNWPEHPDAV